MTYYEVLQVLPTASPEVIKMAYKALAGKYHPDVYPGDKAYAECRMKEINEAYRVLSAPDLRQAYDRFLQQERDRVQEQKRSAGPEQTGQAHHAGRAAPEPQPRSQRGAPVGRKREIAIALGTLLVLVFSIGSIWLAASHSSAETDEDVVSQPKTDSLEVETAQAIVPPTPLQSLAAPEKPRTPRTPTPAAVIPQSGEILSGREYEEESELTISASSTASWVVKLKTASGEERLSFYVRAGATVTVGVPAEHLYVYFASGNTWYGKARLFGDDTYYAKDEELLDFTQYSWSYTLYPVTSGNFSETPIDPDEF